MTDLKPGDALEGYDDGTARGLQSHTLALHRHNAPNQRPLAERSNRSRRILRNQDPHSGAFTYGLPSIITRSAADSRNQCKYSEHPELLLSAHSSPSAEHRARSVGRSQRTPDRNRTDTRPR